MHDKPWVDSLTGPMTYVPARSESLSPSPETVADMISRMIESEWPTTDADRRLWFSTFGLCAEEDEDVPRWGGDTVPGAVPTGWHAFQDEFVGVHWFLWEGWPRSVVADAAAELKEILTRTCGPEDSRITTPILDWTAYWEFEGRGIDMYFYSGLPPAHLSRREISPSVQLHVDHAQRAEAEEAQAVIESRND